MDAYTEKRVRAFLWILKDLGVPKEEATAIMCGLRPEESHRMMEEAFDKLEAGDFKQTPREAMRICGEVIRKYRDMENDTP